MMQGRETVAERIPDEALVVRGGRNEPEDLRRGTRTCGIEESAM
jgi:hypothetical protein